MTVSECLTLVIRQLTKLYARSEPEGDDGTDIPADLVHHFLLAITTRPGTGLCFHDRGWYPRTTEEAETLEGYEKETSEDAKDRASSGGVHNKILRNFIKTLKISEDLRQQELLLKIFEACPELVRG
jgi:nucleolar pre-ribosomal-associated protein 1